MGSGQDGRARTRNRLASSYPSEVNPASAPVVGWNRKRSPVQDEPSNAPSNEPWERSGPHSWGFGAVGIAVLVTLFSLYIAHHSLPLSLLFFAGGFGMAHFYGWWRTSQRPRSGDAPDVRFVTAMSLGMALNWSLIILSTARCSDLERAGYLALPAWLSGATDSLEVLNPLVLAGFPWRGIRGYEEADWIRTMRFMEYNDIGAMYGRRGLPSRVSGEGRVVYWTGYVLLMLASWLALGLVSPPRLRRLHIPAFWAAVAGALCGIWWAAQYSPY